MDKATGCPLWQVQRHDVCSRTTAAKPVHRLDAEVFLPNLVLRRCLEEVSGASNDDERWDAVAASSRVLLQHPEAAAELARRIIAAEDAEDVPTELLLLEALLDGARIDAEGRGTRGPAVLDAIERAIDRRAGEARPGLSLLDWTPYADLAMVEQWGPMNVEGMARWLQRN
jgi:hypothetical protein